jgi:hypothetical protein
MRLFSIILIALVTAFYAPPNSVLTSELHLNISAQSDYLAFTFWMAEESSVAASLSINQQIHSLQVFLFLIQI